MTKNPKHPAGNVARKVGSGFLERLLSFLEATAAHVIVGIKHLTGLKRFIAKEDELDGRMMLRLGAWGIGSIAALVLAIIAVQSPASARRDQPSADVTQQTQQLQRIARESQNQTHQLSAAMDTLNKDRDRLYNRVTVLEQAVDSVNGSIAKLSAPPPVVVAAAAPSTPASSPSPMSPQQVAALEPVTTSSAEVPTANAHPAPEAKSSDQQKSADTKQRAADVKKEKEAQAKEAQVAAAPVAPPKIASVATVSSPTPPPAKSEQKNEPKPEAATKPEAKAEQKPADKPVDQAAAPDQAPAVTGSVASAEMADTTEKPVERTKFGVDLGGANSVEGLRALWRGLRGPHRELFAQMQPLIVVKERTTGYGMQLRLVAGPLTDAAAAAKLCATLTERSKRACEPSVYDGQRLPVSAYRTSDAGKTDAPANPEAAKTDAANADAAKPEAQKKREASNYRRHGHVRIVAPPPQAAAPPPAAPAQHWSLSSIFNRQQ